MKTLDVTEWKIFSERPYSRSYVDPSGTKMLKAVSSSNEESVKYLMEEYKVDAVSNRLGIPTAKVFDLVKTTNDEVAIVYEYISEKVSCSRAISREPDRLEEYAKLFASVVKKIHSIEADTALIPSFASRVFSGLDATKIFSEEEKLILKDRFLALPTDNKCLHGDMNPSNVIHSAAGDFAIDLGLLSYGNPLFDVAFFYYLVEYLPPELVNTLFHFDQATLRRFWEIYVKEYFDATDVREVEEHIKPYAKYACLPVLNVAGDLPSVIAARDFILSE